MFRRVVFVLCEGMKEEIIAAVLKTVKWNKIFYTTFVFTSL